MAGTTSHTMLTGIILFFTAEISALSLAVFGGSLVDILEEKFYSLGMFNIEGSWNNFDTYNQVVAVFYLCPYILAGLGVLILFLTIWHRHGSDREDEEINRYQNL